MRIVFMGTPEFAVESLKLLVENKYNVVGVVTMPDKPAGRGHTLQSSPVKLYALEKGLKVLQPEKLKDESFISDLRNLKPDLQVVVAFRMLPEVVWNLPPMGTFNLHASLLPQYRGAAPINWVIINGENETGVTSFFLTHEIDTGKIILQEKISIEPEDNAGSIHDKLMVIGANLVLRTVDLIDSGKIQTIDQKELVNTNLVLKDAPKIFKQTCELDINKSSKELHNFIKGLSPYPGAWINLCLPGQDSQTVVKVFNSHYELVEHTNPVGSLHTDGKNFLKISLNDGYLFFDTIQIAGKKKMNIADLLRGLR
jgi:methionyl-tRNA formyltransferase